MNINPRPSVRNAQGESLFEKSEFEKSKKELLREFMDEDEWDGPGDESGMQANPKESDENENLYTEEYFMRTNILPDPIIRVRRMVSPAEAQYLLKLNTINRKLSRDKVSQYARDMLNRRWDNNGEGLAFTKGMKILLNGQHRLRAVIKAGISVPMTFCIGVDEKCFKTIDVGKPRSTPMLLAMEGEVNTTCLGAAAKLQWRYEQDAWVDGAETALSHQEVREIIDRHPGLREAARHVSNTRRIIASSIATFLLYQFSLRDAELAMEFFNRLGSGSNLLTGDPVLTLRNRLTVPARGLKLGRLWVLAFTIKAWNAVRQGKPCYQLRWRNDAKPDEAMPDIL